MFRGVGATDFASMMAGTKALPWERWNGQSLNNLQALTESSMNSDKF